MTVTGRVAVLADVHGNLPALEAVLEEVDRTGVDGLVLLGDLAAGPFPAETLALFAARNDVLASVRGNADREMVEVLDGDAAGVHEQSVDAARLLGSEHRTSLADLPLTAVVEVEGVGRVRCCHATPYSDTDIVLGDDPDALLEHVLDGVAEAVVLCGHTHVPFDRRLPGHRLVNPGSVGMPYGRPGAAWALVGPDIELRHTDYDLGAAAARIRRSAWAHASVFADENVVRVPSAEEAYATFRDHPWRPSNR